MKPFEELTRFGRIRRMRSLAQAALAVYGFNDVRVDFQHEAGNMLFRIRENHPDPMNEDENYVNGQYLLRIHQPGYQTSEAIELELLWLAAMCQDARLPVPKPVPNLEGKLLTRVSVPGVPGARNCSLLHWVKGKLISKNIKPDHFRAHGRLMAGMHVHSSHWQLPANLSKRKFDWDGMFRDDLGEGITASEAWTLLPVEYVRPFQLIAERIREAMDILGQGNKMYGLIHGDLGMDANLLFWKGDARAIDFDDSGFGYFAYDLSLALEHVQEDDLQPVYRQALLDGYRELRPDCEEQLKYLDLFLQGYNVYLSLWAATAIVKYPSYTEELKSRMERAHRLVRRYLEFN